MNLILKKNVETASVIIFFAVFVLCLSKPIVDPDVFWHLETGEWIWQNKTLPDKDPFSFTQEPSQYETSTWVSFVLKQYWLGQLMMYGFYHLGGFYGIVAFRCLIYMGIGLILYHWMGRIGVSRINRLVFLMPMVYFSSQWLGERPNNLSFLFAVIVVYLLEDLKNSSNSLKGLNRLKLVSLPLIMLLWANMHGGFILGDAIIAIYMTAGIIRLVIARIKKSEPIVTDRTSSLFFAVCVMATLVSLANPNTYKVISALRELEGSYYFASISETLSPFKYAEKGVYQFLVITGAVVLFFLMRIRRLRLNTALLMSFLALLALMRVRYIPFLIFIATPFIAEVWKEFFDEGIAFIGKITLRSIQHVFFYAKVLLVFCFVIFLLFSQIRLTVLNCPIVTLYYPEATVNFIKAEKPEPEIFNYYAWGGYLIWSLYPDYKVFMDGRGLFQSVFLTYNKALSGSAEDVEGGPRWKAIFDAYRVKAVLVPGANTLSGLGGQFMRIIRRLVEDNQWSLVFVDREALLFIKDTEKNKEIIRKYSKPKIVAYGKALEQAEFYRADNPDDWRAYAALGEINLYMGKPAAALLNFESAANLNPSLRSRGFGRLIEELRAGRDYSKLLDSVFR